MEADLKLFIDENNFYNEIVLGSFIPGRIWKPLPHFFQTWLRNYVGVILLYMTIGVLWSFYIYHLKYNVYVPKDKIPSKKTMVSHICMSMKAMHWYSLVPSVSAYAVENGWTRCFPRISNVGLLIYIVYSMSYFLTVEFGMYWLHRISHHVKPQYKYLHSHHHEFNRDNLLSPFAGFAENPLDGVLQVMQPGIALFVVPMHFTTYLVFLFAEIIWIANIHDNIHANLWPFLGGGFHGVHHRKNKYNYGNCLVLMDWMFGTLCYPANKQQSNNPISFLLHLHPKLFINN